MRGRHTARTLAPRGRNVLAVLAGTVIAAVIAGAVIAGYALMGGSGARPSVPGTAGKAAAGTAASQLYATASAPEARGSKRPSSSPAPSPIQGHSDPFGKAATSYLSTRTGTVLAAVYDVKTGQTWRLGQGRPQAEASVVKLDVLETLLAERGSGGGLSAGDRSLAQQMIEDSDNTAATSLWYEVGGGTRISSFNAKAGLTQTAPSACVVCPGFPWPGWGLTTTTPADQIALLRNLIKPSSVLTSAERDYALSLLENVTPAQRWGVSGGVPAGVTVALKNGWLPLEGTDSDWQINSVGWITGGGRDYVMAVLSTGNPDEQYGIDTIEGLATKIWRDMQ